MHPGGERVAAGDAAGHASVWNLRGGAPVVELEKQATTINDIAFSADGKRLAIACNDGSASVWTLDPKEKTLDLRSGGGAGISAIAFSPQGHRVVTASRAGFATVWDAATGADLLTLESPDDKGKPFTAVAYRPNGDAEQVAIAGMLRGSNGLVRVYDLDRGRLIREAEKLARSGS
jgi:WD40 repeat protein